MPGTAARTLAWAADLFARVRKLRYEGIAIASRIPRMMITTRSSISVKPRSSLVSRCRMVCIRLSFEVTAMARMDRLARPRITTLEGVSETCPAGQPASSFRTGCVRLHAPHRRADVGLRRGLVRPRAEAEVGRDRDREQDPEDDDHDPELDQREALVARSAAATGLNEKGAVSRALSNQLENSLSSCPT